MKLFGIKMSGVNLVRFVLIGILSSLPVIFVDKAAAAPSFAPTAPNIYLGQALVGTYPNYAPVPDDIELFACVDGCSKYRSENVLVKVGTYFNLHVDPGTSVLANKEITFYITSGHGAVKASEKDTFRQSFFPLLNKDFDLHFANLPPVPTPTPTPTPTLTPTPTATPTPTPTATPTATPTPTATATTTPTPTPLPTPTPSLPIVGDPAVRSLPGTFLVIGMVLIISSTVAFVLIRRRQQS